MFRRKPKKRAAGWNWALGNGAHIAPPPPPPPPQADSSEEESDWPAGRVVLGFEDGTLLPLEESNRVVSDFVKAADRIFQAERA